MWTDKDNQLTKTFSFDNYLNAVAFAVKVAMLAEKLEHHPDIILTWGKVIITTTTHDEGNKITNKDIELTRQIDQL